MSNADLLDRFLPGYRLVCRISASYLGLDLTDIVSKAFVLFAVMKSVQYLWSSLSSFGNGILTCSVEVPQQEKGENGSGIYEDVLWWVTRKGGVRGRAEVVSVAGSQIGAEDHDAGDGEKRQGDREYGKVLTYEPAFDHTIYFLRNYRIISLRRQRGKSSASGGGGDTILLTCVGLSTLPLRDFLEECVKTATMGRLRGSEGVVNGKAE
jgi:hypothetical protein